ncbi:hypothetical protein C5E07_11425 [Pseudoclavibacter sp. RFBJ3]|uniref:hypothetical protein n=1 Tax=unclassified Pseudoclavibacter TaxID=2615177 RepID=UPI000CE912A1|nr:MULTISPECIES: hypothetical protein [unclassified Pseudoclavibacter]PPF83296.1 hypothetical protein C5C12_10500 [Pseudoclavibacter sp. RFBJ5]PPF91838.1 hypothetical protein C5E07_11425 [Pseudoclavibacter sp. RFBJ3]PPG01114.1 hypothetical protein C5C19_00530 [Pseudoclavibacter sp. RFBH5]PPG26217.1 hypothetical protein C5E13_00485 [Pseudoclavibacter sp. RFBI4]
MANNGENTSSPFTRPGFIVAAIIVAIVATLGITLAVVGALNSSSGAETAPQASSSGGPSSAPAAPAETAEVTPETGSICGLPGEVLTGSVSTAPEAEWAFDGTLGYPKSATYGPGQTNANGVRSCFQHSPEGAVFAAANAVAQGSNSATVGSFLEYFLAEGPNRDAVLASGPGNTGGGSGVRVDIEGFRVLSYTGDTARIDIAAQGSTNGQVVNVSSVYDLVWEGGDWKLNVVDPNAPIDVATIPDLAGYVAWSA